MKSKDDIFEITCKKEFSFLENLGFAIVDSTKDNYGCRLTYKSDATAVKIELDRATMFIDCYKLKDGNIPKRPIFFDQNEEFLVFDFNDLLMVKVGRKIEQIPKLMYREDYMKEKIKEFAEQLRCHGTDILSGDFSLLPEVKKRVVGRAKELENEQRS